MILSATANVTLGENKITKQTNKQKNPYNNTHITTYFMQAADINMVGKKRKTAKTCGGELHVFNRK